MSEKLEKLLKASKEGRITDEATIKKLVEHFYKEASFNELKVFGCNEVRRKCERSFEPLAEILECDKEVLRNLPIMELSSLLWASFTSAHMIDSTSRAYQGPTYNCTMYHDHEYFDYLYMYHDLLMTLADSLSGDENMMQLKIVNLADYMNFLYETTAEERKNDMASMIAKINRRLMKIHGFSENELSNITFGHVLRSIVDELTGEKGFHRKLESENDQIYYTDFGEECVITLKSIISDLALIAYPYESNYGRIAKKIETINSLD